MKIAILGFDRQGRSALEYWSQHDADITVHDKNPEVSVPAGVAHNLGDAYLEGLDTYDLLVRTPGLHPRDIVNANPKSPDILDKVTTVTNEFFQVCPTPHIIGVTGTKGKGTTSTLITNMLRAAGKRVHLGGNIGIPPLDLLKDDIQADDWVVLELANYQLIDLKYSPAIGVCLMITPEHLDWHESLDEYLRSKQQLFAHQAEVDLAIYKAGDNRSMQLATTTAGNVLPYLKEPGSYVKDDKVHIDGQTICKTSEVSLLGEHNLENICAAVTCVWQITQDSQAIATGIRQTTGLPHRLELAGNVRGVQFFDDSFGTTPESAIAAVKAMDVPTVLIVGGSDKKSSYDALAEHIANSAVTDVVLIGQTATTIKEALDRAGVTALHDGGKTMKQIVQTAYTHAQPEGVVLLSPACASFDMFKNYEDRGKQFKQAVHELASAAQ